MLSGRRCAAKGSFACGIEQFSYIIPRLCNIATPPSDPSIFLGGYLPFGAYLMPFSCAGTADTSSGLASVVGAAAGDSD